MDQQQGPSVQHRELGLTLCGRLVVGEFGGEWVQICVWRSASIVHLKL